MTNSLLKVLSNSRQIFLFVVVIVLSATAVACTSRAETLTTPATIEISFHDGLISAELVNVPLIDVLERIKEEFGFNTHYHGEVTELITASFTDLPLSQCLRLLTANQSLSIATRPFPAGTSQNDSKQITEIWVLSRNANPQRVQGTPEASPIPVQNATDGAVLGGERSQEVVANADQNAGLLDQQLNKQSAEQSSKRQTINNLAAIGDSAAVMAMAEYIRDADKEVRQLSVNAISSVQSEESTLILGQVLQDEPDPDIRMVALRALGQRQNDPTAQTFLEGARHDADPSVKSLADQLLAQ